MLPQKRGVIFRLGEVIPTLSVEARAEIFLRRRLLTRALRRGVVLALMGESGGIARNVGGNSARMAGERATVKMRAVNVEDGNFEGGQTHLVWEKRVGAAIQRRWSRRLL